MNITPQAPNLSIPTVLNPHTESLRRENNQREIITQPAALNQSAAEKGVSSDRERGRTPAQNSENIDFANLKEKAELANNTISEQKGEHKEEQNKESSQHFAINEVQDDEKSNESAESDSRDKDVQQERVINELQRRDKEVRSHELAHAAVGGSFTGAPNYSFETGPDGQKYAAGGEVSVDLSTVAGNPSATIAKMQKVHAAALAPANPSAQDTQVAANAIQIILQAQSELQLQDSHTVKPADDNESSLAIDSGQKDESESDDELSFDAFINKTLTAQEYIAPTQSHEVLQRAVRVETFYSNITEAYGKPATYQFELTA
ncbi:putative metalloprotease CJM1_0395 family protein [Candidatus Colwellia aromaticivorans]|uniref:putative metalloprotease CJM1_0395 family protein n=1 Tax=Candidatus Colwellia aromaticivorans TaxID=2267621 RepID=UPI000DF1AAA5|nr:putative metalloprotease CJM1_0395 family protein [Candidatus Colwellia aromaticivorans]